MAVCGETLVYLSTTSNIHLHLALRRWERTLGPATLAAECQMLLRDLLQPHLVEREREAFATVTHYEAHFYEQCGHAVALDQPERFFDDIYAFLHNVYAPVLSDVASQAI